MNYSFFAASGAARLVIAAGLLLAPLGAALAQAPTITAVSPVANRRNAPVASSVQVTFSQGLTAGSAAALKVYSAQRGGLRTRGTTPAVVSGSTLSFTPAAARPWLPGETVMSTVTTAAASSTGTLAKARVVQFTAAAGGTGRANFQAGSEVGVVGNPLSITMGDVDGDGDLDLLTPDSFNSSVTIRLNGGDASGSNTGVFANGSTVGVGRGPTDVALGDVDGDGDLDFVSTSRFVNQVSVRLNGGDATGSNTGVFSNGSDLGVVLQPYGVALGDVDGDGDLDILATAYYTNNNGGVSVRLNGGDATGSNTGLFSNGSDVTVGTNPHGIAVGDVDGDGDLDFVTANSYGNSVSVRLNGGDATGSNAGTFGGGQDLGVGSATEDVAVGDVDGDGDLDFVAVNSTYNNSSASIRLNGGDATGSNTGTFGGGQNVYVGNQTLGVALGDADADGDLDLFAANITGNVGILLNGGDATGSTTGAFSNGRTVGAGDSPYGLALGDVDGDGDLDVMVANENGGTVSVRLNMPLLAVITSFTPTSGPVGTTLTITGVNLTGATAITFAGSSANVVSTGYAVNAAGTSITSIVVPAGGSTGAIAVTTPNGTSAASSQTFSVTPVVGSFTPLTGPVGTTITITGTGLGGASSVRFNGTPQTTFASNTSTQLVLNVPAGTSTGPLTVTTAGGTSAVSSQTFTVIQPPAIGSFTPTSGAVGTSVTLTGTYLDNASAVRFNGTLQATITGNTSTQVVASVPAGATTGPLTVTTPGGTSAASSQSFTILPGISSFAPLNGPVGTVVTITGTDLGSATGLTLNGAAVPLANISSNTATSLTFTVPAGATSGTLTVSTASGTSAASSQSFTVTLAPLITGVSPGVGAAGTAGIVITGTGLSNAIAVNVSGAAATITANTATSLTFTVPAGASTTQSIDVTTANGTSAAYTTFVVKLLVGGPGTSPAANAHAAPVANSALAVALSEPVTAASIAPSRTTGIKVYSAQVGGRKAGSFTANGNTLNYTSTLTGSRASFRPGEVVSVTVPNKVMTATGLPAQMKVYQFTTAVGAGSGVFLPGTDPAVANSPYGVAVGDVDGDGDLDFVTANANTTGTASVRLNGGDATGTNTGTFSNGTTVSVSAGPQAVVLGDVDGDGDLDLLTANYNANTVSVRLNGGNATGTNTGVFAGFGTTSVGGGPVSLVLGDVDGDGDLDLLTANNVANTVSVRLNGGNATGTNTALFSGIQAVAVGIGPQSVALGDVDGDGDLDLLVANKTGTGTVTVRLNGGDATGSNTGIFANGSSPVVGISPYCVTVGDVDNDGDLDLLVANNAATGTVTVRLNGGDATGSNTGVFSNGSTTSVAANPNQVALGDVDADGDLDFVTANTTGIGTVSVRLNDGTGVFTGSTNPSVGSNPRGVALADVDGDGDLDILTANANATGTVSVRLNQPVPAITSFTPPSGPVGISVTITGTALGSATGLTLNGVAVPLASISSNTATSLTFAVPAGATSGTLTVTTATGTSAASSQSFTVLPAIASFTPTSGPVGTVLDITGTALTGATAITFSGSSGNVVSTGFTVASATSITGVVVPAGAITGTLTVTTASGTSAASSGSFSVTPGLSGLVLSAGSLSPAFASGTFGYTLTVPGTTTTTTVTPTNAQTSGGPLTVNGAAVASGAASGSIALNSGTNTITVVVSPPGGGTATTYTVTVTRTACAVTATARNVSVLLDASGNASTTAAAVNNGSSSTCGAVTLSLSQTAFDCTDIGTPVPVTLTVTDSFGGSATANATVTVTDGIAPTAVARNLSVPLSANGTASITAAAINNGSTDNCTAVGSLVLSVSPNSFTCANVGPNTVTLTVTDASGTASTATATVTVAAPPTPTFSLSPSAATAGTTVTATGTSLSGATALTVNGASATISGLSATGFTFVVPAGAAPTGNVVLTAPCSQSVTQPFSVVPAIASFTPTSGPVGTTISLTGTGLTGTTAITFTGTSGNVVTTGYTVASSTSITGVVVPAGAITGTLTVTTPGGTSAASTGSFTVRPSLGNLALSAGSLSPAFASGTFNYTLTVPGTTTTTTVTPTNAQTSGGPLTVNGAAVASGAASGSIALNPGANTITVVVNPPGAGTATTYTVAVTRTACAVTATARNATVALNASGNATVTAAAVNNGSSSTCGAVTLALSQTAFTCANVGTPVAVTLTVTDDFGGSATAPATVTVTDGLAPTAVAQNLSVQLSAAGTASTTAAAINNGSSDNCTAAASLTLALSQTAFTCADLGNNAVTLTVTDASGNASTATATVTVTAPAPATLTGLSPNPAPAGATVTATGTNLSGATALTVNGASATISGLTGTGFTFVVPAGATASGNVVVSLPCTQSLTQAFATAYPDLTISTGTLASPTAVPAGTYGTITVTGSGVAQFSGAVVATTAVVVSGTLLTDCLQPLTGAGSFTLNAGATLGICHAAGIAASGANGAVQTSGTRSFASDATYVYNGAQAQSTGTGLPATVRALTVDNPAVVGLTQGVTIAQILTLAGAGNLRLNFNTLLLRSDATGTALVVNSGTAVVQGTTATLQRHIATNTSANGYRHYASPMSGETVNTLATAGYAPDFTGATAYNASATPGTVTPFPTVFGYEQNRIAASASNFSFFDKGWQAALSGEAMPVGKGYSVQAPGAALVDFTGTPFSGPLAVGGLARTGAADGWHLLGNPYPAPLDWSTMTMGAGASLDNVDGAVYVFQSSGPYAGSYRTYLAAAPGGSSPLVPAGAGFFVRTTTAGTPGTVRFTNANRVTSFGAQPAFGRGNDTRPVLTLALAGPSGAADALTLYAEPAATAGVDAQYDAAKLANPSGLNLATLTATGAALTIDGRPVLTGTVPLRVAAPAAGTYTCRVAALAHFGPTAVYLRDAQAGTEQRLAAGTALALALPAGAAPAGRFSLVFRPAGALATAVGALAAQATVYPNPAHGAFTLLLPPMAGATQATATLLNALGQVVHTQTLALTAGGATARYATAGLAAGVYALRLSAGKETATLRVVVE